MSAVPFSSYFSGAQGRHLLSRQRFLYPGTYTVVAPADCLMDVMLVGGAGGGAFVNYGAYSASARVLACGCNGPDTGYIFNRRVRAGDTFTIVVGAGGVGQTSGVIGVVLNGNAGAPSSIAGPGVDAIVSGGAGGIAQYNGSYGLTRTPNATPAKTVGLTTYLPGVLGGDIVERAAANALWAACSGAGCANILGLGISPSHIPADSVEAPASARYAVSSGCSIMATGLVYGSADPTGGARTSGSTGWRYSDNTLTGSYRLGNSMLESQPLFMDDKVATAEVNAFGLNLAVKGTTIAASGSTPSVVYMGGGGGGFYTSSSGFNVTMSQFTRPGPFGGAGGAMDLPGSGVPFDTAFKAVTAGAGTTVVSARANTTPHFSGSGGDGLAIVNFRY